jgi:hypothetical protein
MKKKLTVLLFVIGVQHLASAQITPTECANVYQVTSSSTTAPSTLWAYNSILGTRTSLGTLPGFVNGIGHNQVDNYLWGSISGNTIVKIGTNANWETHTIANLPTGGAWNTGTISADGYYYLTTTSSTTYYTIDLNPSHATYLKLVDPTAGYVLDNTAPFGNTMSPIRDISDWAYNPVDGKLYAMMNQDNVDAYHLMVFDPHTGVSTRSSSPITGGDIEASDYGGAYFDNVGNFYIIRNESGHFYRINTTTFTATRISGLSVSYTEYNDAAACASAPPVQTDLGDAPDTYGTLFNSGGAVHILSNNLKIGSLVDAEDDGIPSAGASGDDSNKTPDDEDGLTTIPPIINNATSYSLNVAVTNTSGASAVLAGWIDFNGDGIFQNSERVQKPVTAGQTSVVLNWSGLTGIAAGTSYIRLRIAADGNEILNATGPAGTGEVEDYAINIAPSISGNVFNDANGLNDAQVNGTPINAAGAAPLYVSLYNGTTLIATVPVKADGTYQFVNNVTLGTTYTVVLGTNAVANTSSPFAGAGTGGWVSVGEDCCDNTGGDGNTNGVLTITVGTSVLNNANFGVERLPESDQKTPVITQPTLNQIITLNGGTNPPVLSGSDPEDLPAGGVLTNKSVTITAVPANSELYYDNVLVTNGTTIPNFDPSKLQVKITSATLGSTSTQFEYAYVDAAGVTDPTPAIYKISWDKPLPVTLINFEVVKSESLVQLSWSTASEKNSSYFDIERSADARTWISIGQVAAKEQTNSISQYHFTDQTPGTGINYYRLKMTDLDDSFAYSKIRSVALEGTNISMYPNPVTTQLNIDNMGSDQIQKMVLYNMTGTALYSNDGVIKHTIDMTNLKTGIYVLTITLKSGGKFSKTIIKN